MTYTELKAQILSWSHRADLVTKVDEFIDLAENVMFRELSLRAIEATTTGTTSGDTLTLPADYASIERIQIDAGGVEYSLTYTSPNGIESLTASTNRPSRFTIEGGTIRLISAPSGPFTYVIFYVPRLTALSTDHPENWVSTNHPDAYLSGAMAECGRYTVNDAMVNRHQPLFMASMDSIKRFDERARFPISGGLQMKVRNAR